MTLSAPSRDDLRILVLGATGVTGAALARLLDADPAIEVVRAARRPEQVAAWQAEGKAAVAIDLNDARTFPAALAGIDRLFVMSGYTIEMVHQVKTITDAAVDAGVGFIVHLGVYSNGRETDPHFVWHELVERYIRHSGVASCHLHPNMFMENLLTTQRMIDDRLYWPMGDAQVGWIAGDDLTAVAAKVLAEGPDVHAGADYYLSTDLLDGPQTAAVLAEALGRPIGVVVATPDTLEAALKAGTLGLPSNIEPNYAASIVENVRQIFDGRMAHIGAVTNTVETLLGRAPVSLSEWARRNRDALGDVR
jgi:NAD(P)H dehydrogenase (quinone)